MEVSEVVFELNLGPDGLTTDSIKHLRKKLYQFCSNSSRKVKRKDYFPNHSMRLALLRNQYKTKTVPSKKENYRSTDTKVVKTSVN